MNPGEIKKRRNWGGEAISPDLAGGMQSEGRPASQPVGAKFDEWPSDSLNAELCNPVSLLNAGTPSPERRR